MASAAVAVAAAFSLDWLWELGWTPSPRSAVPRLPQPRLPPPPTTTVATAATALATPAIATAATAALATAALATAVLIFVSALTNGSHACILGEAHAHRRGRQRRVHISEP